MDNRSSYVCYVPGRSRPTFVSTNNVVFGNKCPLAKDLPNVIDNDQVVLDFPPEANVSDISDSSVESILDQSETHYILQMTNGSVKSIVKPVFESSFVRAQNNTWSQKNADIMNQVLFLHEVNVFNSNSFFNAESVNFTNTTKYVDPTSYADAMSRPDGKEWQEAFDKEMNGLRKSEMCSQLSIVRQIVVLLVPQWFISTKSITLKELLLASVSFVCEETGKRTVSTSLRIRRSAQFLTLARI